MKIEQGYTLSQFVDYCETQTAIEMAISYMDIVKYNNFLKQPLSKEMFVNELKEPDAIDYVDTCDNKTGTFDSKNFDSDLNKWQEAEKKVIFKGWRHGQGDIYNDKMQIVYNVKSNSIFINHWIFNPTLNDLFEATKGQLKLKNIEL